MNFGMRAAPIATTAIGHTSSRTLAGSEGDRPSLEHAHRSRTPLRSVNRLNPESEAQVVPAQRPPLSVKLSGTALWSSQEPMKPTAKVPPAATDLL